MLSIHSFVEEFKNRKLGQVTVFYLATAWVLLEVFSFFSQRYNLDSRLVDAFIIVALCGLPATLIVRWHQSEEGSMLRRKRYVLILVSNFIVAIFFVYKVYQIPVKAAVSVEQTPPPDKSVAVLPFVNLSNDPNQEYFSDGLSEELLNLLSKIAELKVIGRTSSFSFKGKNEDLRTIGEKLGVANILEGSVQKEGNNIRVTAQLIRAADGFQLWSEKYDRDLKGIFNLQDEIAGAVVKQLQLKLMSVPKSAASQTNIEVHKLLLQGNYFWDRGGAENYNKADEFYNQALAIDSGNARIWAAMTKVKITRAVSSYKDYRVNFNKAREYAARAILLDGQLPEAHRVMGVIMMFYDFDWQGAEREYGRALELEPGNSDTYRNLAQLENILGRYEAAVVHFEKALELNPLNWLTISNLANTLLLMSKHEEAIRIFKNGMELNPQGANQGLAYAYLVSNKPRQTLEQLEKIPNGSYKTYLSAMAYHELGRRKEAKEAFDKVLLEYKNGSYRIAQIYAFMNQKDKAFRWLEKAYSEKYFMWVLKTDYLLTNLRGDPRYISF